MKKVLAVLFAASLAVSMVACGGDKGVSKASENTESQVQESEVQESEVSEPEVSESEVQGSEVSELVESGEAEIQEPVDTDSNAETTVDAK